MAYSYVRYTGNGSTVNYTFSFPYISQGHIKVRLNGVLTTAFTFLNSSTIQFTTAPTNGVVIEIRRETPKDQPPVNFTDGSVLLERDLDLLATWELYVAQETDDDLEDTIRVDSQGRFDALNKRIINVADPVNAQDAVTKNWAETAGSSFVAQAGASAYAAAASKTNAASSASAAATSATNSANSATSATNSATAAATSATNAANSATAASTSASNANTSAVAAASSATAAAATYDNFDDRYLGPKDSAPTLDNDGNTLLVGAMYWDAPASQMFVWSGTAWKPTFVTGNTVRSVVTATAGQTAVTAPTYVIGNASLQVYANGVKLIVGTNYTETTQNSITMTSGLTAGDKLELIAFQAYPIGTTSAGNVSFQQAGTGSTVRTVDVKLKEVVSVKDFGAVGDGVTDDYAAIQAALNAVPNGGSLYFPKQGGGYTGPSYYISQGLVLAKNDVTIYTDPRPEYSEGIKTDQAITMLTVTGFGLKVMNIAFKGNGSVTAFGTTNGIVFDRRSLGDAETYSNLDGDLRDCSFMYLNDAITGYGRNVFVFDNMFSNNKRGVVGLLHTYGGGASTSEFRGWRINRNRFHSMGNPYLTTESSTPAPASIAVLDAWCVQMPQTSNMTTHLEVMNNNADFCGGGFYKGYLAGAKIANNIWNQCAAIFVYANITDTNNQALGDSHLSVIENNTLNNRNVTSTANKGFEINTNAFLISNVRNMTIQGNVVRNAYQDLMVFDGCNRLRLLNNTLYNGNNRFASDSTTRPGVTISNSSDVRVMQNDLLSQVGTVYSNGFATSSVPGIKFRDNTVRSASNKYLVAASDLVNSDDDGLAWQTPTMLNGYVLGAQSRGYRRLFNGMVEIDVMLTAGADNVAAFTLPSGYRPAVSITLPSTSVWATNDSYTLINASDGNVVVNWNTTAATQYHVRHIFEAA